MKIINKKYIIGFIAGIIVALLVAGILDRPPRSRYDYLPGPEGAIYKVDKATGDVFWIKGTKVTKVEAADGEGAFE